MEIQSDHQILPCCWHWSNLGDIISYIGSGITPKGGKAVYQSSGIPFIRSQNVYPGNLRLEDVAYINAELHESMSRTHILPNDVLLNITGASIGRSAVIPPFFKDGNVNQHVCILRLFSQIDSNYISWFLNSPLGQKQIMDSQFGVTRQGLNYSQARMLQVPLAPLAEQQRIVARIEELFSRMDAGVKALQKAKVQLQRYRQSVLKAAVEGRLTEEWRKAHPDVEPAENLLRRIAEKQHNGKRKTNELLNCDLYELLNLPETWTWTRIGDISEQIQYGTSEKAGEDPIGIPVIRMGNIQEGKLAFEKLKYMPNDFPEVNKFILRDGDVLFNRTNSAELVGKTAVYKNYHAKSVFASYLIRIAVDKTVYNPDFLSYFINSTYGRKYIAAVVSQQVGQANVNGTKLASMTIPLPSIEEQAKTVEHVERNIFESAETEVNIVRIQSHTDYLRQSILKHAFEGKLVPQDPNEGPASVLLERIRAERVNGSPRRGRKSSINTNQMRLIQ